MAAIGTLSIIGAVIATAVEAHIGSIFAVSGFFEGGTIGGLLGAGVVALTGVGRV